MEAEQRHQDEDRSEQTHPAEGQTKMTRREALSIVGKHAVYTAPAVLAVLAATKAKNAHADEISF